jgi:hypothetical protein
LHSGPPSPSAPSRQPTTAIWNWRVGPTNQSRARGTWGRDTLSGGPPLPAALHNSVAVPLFCFLAHWPVGRRRQLLPQLNLAHGGRTVSSPSSGAAGRLRFRWSGTLNIVLAHEPSTLNRTINTPSVHLIVGSGGAGCAHH